MKGKWGQAMQPDKPLLLSPTQSITLYRLYMRAAELCVAAEQAEPKDSEGKEKGKTKEKEGAAPQIPVQARPNN